MFEPEELMARIVDLEEQLKVSEMAPPAAEQLIACLEGEIAKRDARIVELEGCKAGLESDVARLREKNATFSAAWDELAALKAQEPAFMWHKGATEDESEVVDVDCACPCCVPLYAAPVSEAKAQGVVMPAELDRAFITGESCDGVYRVVIQSETLKEMQAVHSWLARLNAAPAAPAADAGYVFYGMDGDHP